MTPGRASKQPVVKMTRVIRAPRERVFRAWTDADDIKRWWGRPEGFDVPEAEVDLRVGGTYRIVMQTEGEGPEYPVTGSYLEVVPPERLVYSFRWENDLPLALGDHADETRVTVEFRDLGDATEVVLTHRGFSTDESSSFHHVGWQWSFDRLEALVEEGSVTP